ncbi:MAG: hypothetical protein A4E69_01837 [Syntrophus sp. PtaB.Bin138]|nr:MAG: hypothetical protein A4E69_01837 [Syntrophus sp. PtaB.Bin138]
MDRFVLRDLLIEFIGIHDRAVFHAGGAARAFALVNIPGLLHDGDGEVSRFPLHALHLGIGDHLDIGMPLAFNEFGRFDAHGAVVGGKGLVEMGHLPADGRRFLDKIDLESCRAEIKGRLDPADASTDNHDVAKITVR